jgi:signal transduction histidine kinase
MVSIGPNGVHVGRDPEVDVILSDPLVSRVHTWIGLDGSDLVVRDNDSRNGVFVNGDRVEESPLTDGDAIGVGDYTFIVERREDVDVGNTLLSYEDASVIFDAMVEEEQAGRLPILYKAAQLLGTVFDTDDLLEQILAIIFDALPVKRGYILTTSAGTDPPEVHASKVLNEERCELPRSQTLIDHVLNNQSAILTPNAQKDPRFDASESITSHKIQSAMCAPLVGREGCVGAIYVDSGMDPKPFSDEDLQLLTAIGRVVGVAVENARLYKESLEKERLAAIGEATAGLGHCVKNIMTGLKAGGEFVEMSIESRDWKWVDKGWPVMKSAAGRIELLMLNMLTYSTERTPDLQPASLNDLCMEVVHVVEPRAQKCGVSIALVPGELDSVHIDGREIYRVVLNLLVNAIEACEEKKDEAGAVTVATRQDVMGSYIEVRDDGVGIPPEIMDKMADAFVSTKGSRGTGLGLACSYKIVREHMGQITVESTPGQGAAFTVYLPFNRPDNRGTKPIVD